MAIDQSLAVRELEGSVAVSPTITSKTKPSDVIRNAKELGIKIVDLRFVDLIGTWQHFSIPVGEMTESLFTEGIGFDGSSIRGFQKIYESDMLLFPDPGRTFVDSTLEVPTLAMVCDIKDPLTLSDYSRDPRYVARKAEAYLLSTGIADTSYWGPELEFYIFNSVRFDQNTHEGYYHIDSDEGIWNTGKNGTANLGFRPKLKQGYFPTPPIDKLQDLRSKIVLALIDAGVQIEVHHHEVGTAGQTEIDMRFDSLVNMADKVLIYKHIVKNVCYQNGYTAPFMPLFYDKDGYALLSDTARWYIGGLLKHAPAVLAFAAPTTNSYRRLVPGYEAPIKLAYSARNRSACVRIPTYSAAPAARRLEFRSPDPMCNPYLSFSACLMAGLDGVKHRIEPPTPVEADLYELEGEEKARVKDLPGSLTEVLNALEVDNEFLLEGGVFTQDLIDMHIAYKRENEVDPVALRPHPYEFALYYDA
jgi:glutamine synthetase